MNVYSQKNALKSRLETHKSSRMFLYMPKSEIHFEFENLQLPNRILTYLSATCIFRSSGLQI